MNSSFYKIIKYWASKNEQIKELILFLLKFKNKLLYKKEALSRFNPKESNISYENIKKYNENRLLGYQKNICNAPSTSLYFRANGDVLMCCYNYDDSLGNVKDNDITQLVNSPIRKKLKEDISKYVFNKGCSSCKGCIENNNFGSAHSLVYDENREIEKKQIPKEITFEISNTCNLECVMCDGKFSSLIRKNREELPPILDNYPVNFLEQLKPYLLQLNIARFQGGEPFLVPKYLEIIEYLIAENKNCKIYIQTNGTINNNRVKRIIKHNNVILSVSIDSLDKERYEEIRVNAVFKNVITNILEFKDSSINKHNNLNINFCFMKKNWVDLISMIAFCKENKFTLNVIMVEFPTYCSIGDLQLAEIEIIINKFENFLLKNTNNNYYNKKIEEVLIWLLQKKDAIMVFEKLKLEIYLNKTNTELIEILKTELIQKFDLDFSDFYVKKLKEILENIEIKYINELLVLLISDTFLYDKNEIDTTIELNIELKHKTISHIKERIKELKGRKQLLTNQSL